MARELVATKLYLPRTRPGLVVRSRHFERLESGATARLVLVSAPPGFGKTTLLAEWARTAVAATRRVAWLSLDQGENDPASFSGSARSRRAARPLVRRRRSARACSPSRRPRRRRVRHSSDATSLRPRVRARGVHGSWALMSTPSGRDEPVAAALRVSGRLDARWAAWFDGLTLSHDPDGTTALTGTVSDQAQLHALLVRIRDLGMTLVSLTTYSVADSLAPDFAPPPDGLSALSPACDHGWMRITALPAGLATAAVDLWRSCGLTRPWNDPAADLTRALAGPASTVLAAIEDEHLLGTVMVGHDGHRGWVYYLAVHAARRGTGLGRTLMTAAESWLEQQGMSKVQLMVRSDNHAVVGFYEELGYVDQGVLVLGRFLDPELQALREREQHDADPHGGGGVVDARTAHHRGVGAGRLTPPGAG